MSNYPSSRREHVEPLSIEPQLDFWKNIGLIDGVRRFGTVFFTTIFGAAGLHFASSFTAYITANPEKAETWNIILQIATPFIQFAIISAMIFIVVNPTQDVSNTNSDFDRVIHRFQNVWLSYWLMLAVLYLLFGIAESLGKEQSYWTEPLQNIGLLAVAVVVFLMFEFLFDFVASPSEGIPRLRWPLGALFLLFAIALNAISLIYASKQHGIGSEEYQNMVQNLKAFSGVASCLSYLLLIGILSSWPLCSTKWHRFILFSYAALQMSYDLLADSAARVLIFNAALLLKIFLCIYVTDLISSGRLKEYLKLQKQAKKHFGERYVVPLDQPVTVSN